MSTLAPPVQGKQAQRRAKVKGRSLFRRLIGKVKTWLFVNVYESERSDVQSFTMSLIVHVVLLLLLAILSIGIDHGVQTSLILTMAEALEDTSFDLTTQDTQQRVELERIENASEPPAILSIAPMQALSPEFTPTLNEPTNEIPWKVDNSFASLTTVMDNVSKGELPSANHSSAMFAASSVANRNLSGRGKIALENGGTEESEAAVDAALVWFAKHQAQDGSWSTLMKDEPCNGKCSQGSNEPGSPKRIAATGLALLCFLGAGHTHRVGDYKEEVYKALMYLVEAMKRGPATVRDPREEGRFLNDEDRYEMYEHGIAVLALCEAYQMTEDKFLKRSCQSGIDFLYTAQCVDGSWGYRPRDTGDLSIVGWQVMALKSAMSAGLTIRPETVRKVDRFLDTQQSEEGSFYGYRSQLRDPCMTSIGLLLRLYRGWSWTDPRFVRGTTYLLDLGPSTNGIYYDYYATHLLFHSQNPRWPEWNRMIRGYLVQSQSKDGHESGSWFFDGQHFNSVGGRLYCTAMATLTLEVYYRHMPIYQNLNTERFEF